jgi:hypothetical protein
VRRISFLFRGFNGRLVKKSPERTSPGHDYIAYGQFSTLLALWLGGVMGLSPEEFLEKYGSQSDRNGEASAASNAGISLELWGQHGVWKSAAAQSCYMKRGSESILSVSRASMRQVGEPEPLWAAPIGMHGIVPRVAPSPEDEALNVEGVPTGSFACLSISSANGERE